MYTSLALVPALETELIVLEVRSPKLVLRLLKPFHIYVFELISCALGCYLQNYSLQLESINLFYLDFLGKIVKYSNDNDGTASLWVN